MNLALLTSSIWVTFGPVLVVNAIVITTLIIFTFSKNRPEKPDYLKGRHESKFLGSLLREWWYWFTNPIAKFLIKIRLNPNSITLIGTFIGFIAAIFFAYGLFGYAGWIMVFGATFDMFDGRVARLQGKETRSGAYLDSVMDRLSEGAVFIGLAYYFRNTWLLPIIIVGLIGSMMVSYTRARGEGVGVVCKKGSMQRPERIVYIGVSAILQPVAYSLLSIWWASPPPVLVIGAILIIAVMTNVTATQRMIAIMNELDTADRDEEDLSLPQLLSSFSTKEGRNRWLLHAKYGYDRSQALKRLCILILVNGANWQVFNDLVARGDLPNICRHIIEPGTFAKSTTTFPSTTGPAFAPFVTGCFAGTCDIPGVKWFDRRVPTDKKLTIKRFRDYYGWGSYAMDSDLSRQVKTIFEYSRKAVNIMGMLNRGAGVTRDPAFFRTTPFFYSAKKKDDEVVERTAYRMFLSALKRSPDFIFYCFPTVGQCAGRDRSAREQTRDAYRRLDSYVGKMADALSDLRSLDSTAFILTGDHGCSNAEKHFDLNGFFEERFKTIYDASRFKEWMSAEVINMISGNSMSNVYLRKDGWDDYSFFEEIEQRGIIDELLNQEAVDLVSGRSSDGGVVVASRRGCARILEDVDGRLKYELVDKDPFGYADIPPDMSKGNALKGTWNSSYPDGIFQSLQLFRSERSGDIVISAAPGYDLKNPLPDQPDFSSHGSLHAEHMFVPFCMNGKVDQKCIRTADIFPTILKTLGIEADHQMDGVSLI